MAKIKKIGCVVIARLGSSRLPGKVLKTIKNEPLLIWLLKRIKKIKYFKNIVVATTTNKEDDKKCLRTGDRSEIKFMFTNRPEFITIGSKLIFREGKAKGIGKIIEVLS